MSSASWRRLPNLPVKGTTAPLTFTAAPGLKHSASSAALTCSAKLTQVSPYRAGKRLSLPGVCWIHSSYLFLTCTLGRRAANFWASAVLLGQPAPAPAAGAFQPARRLRPLCLFPFGQGRRHGFGKFPWHWGTTMVSRFSQTGGQLELGTRRFQLLFPQGGIFKGLGGPE